MNQWKASLALSLSIWIVEHLSPNISTYAFIQSVCLLLHYISQLKLVNKFGNLNSIQ